MKPSPLCWLLSANSQLKTLCLPLFIFLTAGLTALGQAVVPIHVLRLPKPASPEFQHLSLGRDGKLQCQFIGQPGMSLNVEQSIDLTHWSTATNVILGSSGIPLTFPMSRQGRLFFRATQANHPLNDPFDHRLVVRGERVSMLGSSHGATRETGEPFLAVNQKAQNTVWYEWTAPRSGLAVLKTVKSFTSPYLSVFTGTKLSLLKPIASGADKVTFQAQGGVTYSFSAGMLASSKADQDNYFLLGVQLFEPPQNDALASRIKLTGSLPLSLVGHNVGATLETNESAELPENHSVWYEWTPPQSGFYKVSVRNNQYASVSVLQGRTMQDLKLLAVEHDWEAPFQATGGGNYLIKVGTVRGFADAFNLQIVAQNPPINDRFARSLPLQGSTFKVNGTFAGATREADLGALSPARARLWWTWTAPASGRLVVAPDLASHGAGFEIYTGSSVADLAPQKIAYHSFAGSFQAIVEKGKEYRFSASKTLPGQAEVIQYEGTLDDDWTDLYEPDNTGVQAQEIQKNESQTRSIYPAGDEDMIRFAFPDKATDLQIRVTSSFLTTRLVLYKGLDVLVSTNNNGVSDVLQVSIPSLEAGTYYFKVAATGGNETITSYSVKVDWTQPVVDAYEPDDDPLVLSDTPADNSIFNGDTQYRSISPAGDLDIVYLGLWDRTVYGLTIETAGDAGDTQIYFYDADSESHWDNNGTFVPDLSYWNYMNDDDGMGQFSKLHLNVVPPSGYYLAVKAKNPNQVIPAYTLKVSWEAEDCSSCDIAGILAGLEEGPGCVDPNPFDSYDPCAWEW